MAAARHGLTGPGIDPFTGQATNACDMLSRLVDYVRPALGDRGDTETITGLLHELDNPGTGADRQRALFAVARSAPALVEALARATPARRPAGLRLPAKRTIRAVAGPSQPACDAPVGGRQACAA